MSIKANSTVIFGRRNKVERLKHHIVLCSKLVTVLQFYVNYCRCAINANHEDGRKYYSKHVELIEISNKTVIVASSWLFILLQIMCIGFILKLLDSTV